MTAGVARRPTPKRPPRLRPGDVVGIVSPSSPVAPESDARLHTGVCALEALGLRVRVGDHVFAPGSYSAGTPESRARALMETWHDPQVRMVLMSQGGQTANGLLDGLDYAAFARDPKVFMGMSDGTTLVNALAVRAGIVTFHGPDLLFGFGRPMRAEVVDQCVSVLFDARPASLVTGSMGVHREGHASGPLVGGHINILLATMLAGYGPVFDESVLFLEGTHPIDELDRMFTVLRLRGVFDRIAALVLGHFSGPALPDSVGGSVPELALRVCSPYDFPIVELTDLGHHVDNIVVPLGVRATVDTHDRSLALDEPAVV